MQAHHPFTRRQLLASAVLASTAQPLSALAQAWPAKPVRFIVPFPPGGPVDTTARAFSQRLAEIWKTPTVIDNRAGAGGVVGATAADKEAPDGYGLFVGAIHHSVNPTLMGKLPYDTLHDLEPVALVGTIPHLLVVAPSQPFKSVAELLAAGKARPGEIAFASGGNGTILQMQAELLAMRSGVRFLHVPYKGDTPALQDTLGAQVQFMFAPVAAAMPHVKAGKLRALAVTSATRLKVLPDVPTMAEAGQKDFVVEQWQGVYLPARTPATTVQRLNAEINKALKDNAVTELADKLGVTLVGGSPKVLAETQTADSATWARVIRTANIKAD